ncbi:MAG TPA: methylated-DNA--[protein]-cysteine S-methyltransferase, partial [Chloroflexi bacterium]|nr:methylated-DNA--[protein]-cysteine S-methyltransferase [Chloroflexota bacterium]
MNQLVWDSLESPFGPVYVALGEEGVCRVSLGGDTETFLSQFNSSARPRRDPTALAPVTAQLREYFSGGRVRFDLPLDLSSVTPF